MDKVLLNIINQKIKRPDLSLKEYLESKSEGILFFNDLLDLKRIVEKSPIRIVPRPPKPHSNWLFLKKVMIFSFFIIIFYSSIQLVLYYLNYNNQSEDKVLNIKGMSNFSIHFLYTPKIVKDGSLLVSIEKNAVLDSANNVSITFISEGKNLEFSYHKLIYQTIKANIFEIPFKAIRSNTKTYPCKVRLQVDNTILEHKFVLLLSFFLNPVFYWLAIIALIILILFIKKAPKMSIFSGKPECKKFFTYETRMLDIKGLKATLGPERMNQFDFGIGEVSIKPQFVEATEKLKELDFLQFSICSNIKQLSDNDPAKSQFIRQLIKTQIDMLKIAQNPQKLGERIDEYERTLQPNINKSEENVTASDIPETYLNNDKQSNERILQNKNKILHNNVTAVARMGQLEIKISENEDLLKDWEEKRDLAENPSERRRCEIEIKKIKEIIKGYQDEYNELKDI
ncbi:MAG TPA: hypothetical protein VK179_21260 [Bacteroidales bacterium]|nr:hypothetical protein [Bacteroidales bacterium]